MQVVPFVEDFEKGVIAGVLQDPALLPRVATIVSPEDFYKVSHKEIWEAINNIPIDNLDSLAVESQLADSGTKDYFKQLVQDSDSFLPGLSNVFYYAETIKDKARLRNGIELGREIQAICFQEGIDTDAALEQLEGMFSSFIRTRVKDSSIESTRAAFETFIANLGQRVHDTSGIKTGFRSIDLILHRLEGLIILAARPSVGKTSLLTSIIRNVADHKPVLFFSLEQPKEQIFERLLSAESDVPHEDISTGVFVANPKHVIQIEDAALRLSDLFDKNIHVDDTPNVTASYIASVSRQKAFELGEIGLIAVDYLHIMNNGTKATVEALGDTVKELRALGRELECPVILLSQLSRQPTTTDSGEGRVHRRPELTDLRSSGEIEQTADVVMFLHRESYYDQTGYVPPVDELEVIIKKNRNGRTGITTLDWYPPYMKYVDNSGDGIWSAK